VLRSFTSYNTNDYWELIKHESGLPWESSLYVPKILAAAIVGRNQAAFGFADVTPDAPFAFEEVEVPAGTTLAAVARAAGAKSDVVETLNPQFLRARTPPERAAARVRVPVGCAAAYAANIDKARAADKTTDTVVLRFGETLDDVARTRGVAVRELRRLNGVKDSAELRAGTAIVVPRRGTAVAAKDPGKDKGDKSDRGKDDDDGRVVAGRAAPADDDMVLVAVPERSFSYEGRERVFYRTRDGDALDEIAETFGVMPDDIVEWNNLDPAAKLQPRLILQMYVRKDFDPAGVFLVDSSKVRVVTLGSEEFLELETAQRGKKRVFYTCKSGDNLAKVGRRYGLTAGDLARINRFSYNTELHEGQKIVVYSPSGEVPREVTMGLTPEPRRSSSGDARRSSAAGSGAGAHAKGSSPSLVAKSGGSGASAGSASGGSAKARGSTGPAKATASKKK
jgi:membrane-bound lytic murein transglycosylase D